MVSTVVQSASREPVAHEGGASTGASAGLPWTRSVSERIRQSCPMAPVRTRSPQEVVLSRAQRDVARAARRAQRGKSRKCGLDLDAASFSATSDRRRRPHGSWGSAKGSKRWTRSLTATRSAGAASPRLRARSASTAAGSSPCTARSASVTAPWRLARRVPSGPSTSGTCAYAGTGRPSTAARCDLARRRRPEVVAPHHLADALRRRRRPRRRGCTPACRRRGAAPRRRPPTSRSTLEAVERHGRPRPRRGAAAQAGDPPAPARARWRGGEVAARPGVGALGMLARVRRRRRPRGSRGGCSSRGRSSPARSSCRDGVVVQRVERSDWRTTGPSQSRPRAARSASWLASWARLEVAADRGLPSAAGSGSPSVRAKSHASSAVRRLPRWRSPVGLGAKRPFGTSRC